MGCELCKLSRIHVGFDRSPPVYFVGETVRGRVTINVDSPLRITGVVVSLVGRASVTWKEEVVVTSRYAKPRQRLKKVKAHEELCRLEQRVSLSRLLATSRRARPRSSTGAFAGARARSPESSQRVRGRKRQRSAPSRNPASYSGGGVGDAGVGGAGGVDYVHYVRYVSSPPPPPPPPPQFAGGSRSRGRGPGSGFGMESSGKDTSSEDTGSVHSLSTLFSMSSLASVPEAPRPFPPNPNYEYEYPKQMPSCARGLRLPNGLNGVSHSQVQSSRDKSAPQPSPNKSAATSREQVVTLTPGTYRFPFRFRLPAHLPCSLRLAASRAGGDATAATEEELDSEWECDVVKTEDESEKDGNGNGNGQEDEEKEEDDDGEGPLWSASAEYAVRVALEGWPDSCGHVSRRSFTVIRNLDLKDELPSIASPVFIERRVKLSSALCGCLGGGEGAIAFSVQLDRAALVCGQIAHVSTDVHNQSSRQVTGSRVVLEQTLVLHGPKHSQKVSVPLFSVAGGPVAASRRANYYDIVSIPPVPPSRLDGCSLIDLYYILVVSIYISSKREWNLFCKKQPSKGLHGQKYDIRIPIVIGTIPRIQERANLIPSFAAFRISTDTIGVERDGEEREKLLSPEPAHGLLYPFYKLTDTFSAGKAYGARTGHRSKGDQSPLRMPIRSENSGGDGAFAAPGPLVPDATAAPMSRPQRPTQLLTTAFSSLPDSASKVPYQVQTAAAGTKQVQEVAMSADARRSSNLSSSPGTFVGYEFALDRQSDLFQTETHSLDVEEEVEGADRAATLWEERRESEEAEIAGERTHIITFLS